MTKTVKLLGPVKIGAKWHGENDDVDVDAETLAELVGLGLVSLDPTEDVDLAPVTPEPGNAIHENVRAELELQLKAANARADHLAEARKALQDEAVQRDARIEELTQEVAALKAQIAAASAPPPASKAKTNKA